MPIRDAAPATAANRRARPAGDSAPGTLTDAIGGPGPLDAAGGPRAGTERIVVIDAVRGVALLGILVVNAMFFLWPVQGVVLGLPEVSTPLDAAAKWLVTFAFEGKYFTLFSLLFGVGVTMQIGRGHRPGRVLRRLAVLAGFGALHVSLLWSGDILLHYAVLGVVLLLTRSWPARRLLRTAVALLVLPIALQVLFAGLAGLGPDGAAAVDAAMAEVGAGFLDDYDAAMVVYRSGDLAAMSAQRWRDWGFLTTGMLLNGMVAMVVAMFLLGAAAQQSGWTTPGASDRWRWAFVRALPVAIVANLVYALAGGGSDAFVGGWRPVLVTTAFVVGAVSGSLTIATGLALALRRGGAAATALAAVGRLALTTYLTQSLVFTTLAYGTGFGLYGGVSRVQALGLALALFALQTALAVAWTRRFAFGPAEWLWRALTYGRRPTRRPGARPAS